MLTELQIVNVAIIDKETIRFESGLNVISGETGAGKSIILEGLRLILGGRGSVETIRSGCDALEVTAVFDLTSLNEDLYRALPEIIISEDSPKELVLTRELTKTGRNKIFINGRSGSVSLLTEIAGKLISICGQNQSQQLHDPAFHLDLIDSYGAHQNILEKYQLTFDRWFSLRKEIEAFEKNAQDKIMRRQGFSAVVDDLLPLKLTSGLKLRIEQELKRLSSAEQLVDGTASIIDIFSGDEGISKQFHKIHMQLAILERLDPTLNEITTFFETARTNLQEFERELEGYANSLTVDEETLKDVQDKLSEIIRLEKKYRTDEAGLVKLLQQAEAELALDISEESLDKMHKQFKDLGAKLKEDGDALRVAREKAAKKLIKEVEKELSELNMNDARFKVLIQEGEATRSGSEQLEFLISTNKGEDFRSIRQVASGGELSRIMLILKKVLREKSGVNVLVFDEVDSGISGGVARAVGEKLKALSVNSQVICITHLAQVASLADKHLLVEKIVTDRTRTAVLELGPEQRVDEIARMLAGYKVTAASRASARELLTSYQP